MTEEVEKTNKRLISKSFRFSEDQSDYQLKLHKVSRWWLLLFLLLLPLILLIPLKKTVYVKTMEAESGAIIQGAEVTFRYHKAFLYYDGILFTNDEINILQATDENGVAAFIGLNSSLYSYLFKHNSKTLIFATSNCFVSDTLTPLFHSIDHHDTLILSLHSVLLFMDFKVIDADDREPLPDAVVTICAHVDGIIYKDSISTGPDGRVVTNKIPKCLYSIKIKAEADGYYPDSIIRSKVEELAGPLETSRLLRLRPIKKPITFYVVECESKKPIPYATVTIEFDFSNKKTSITKKTNVNGVGKGFYQDAHIIARIHLKAEQIYYKPGQLPGWHLVKEFINPSLYPPEKRTICLEPEEYPVTFLTIDEKTHVHLGGVKNTITINNSGVEKVQTIYSNSNGEFLIAGIKTGDMISILSQFPPDYYDNDSTIRSSDGLRLVHAPLSERTIPLKPVEVELIFRTIEAASGDLIPNAGLEITIDGNTKILPSSSGSGEFIVKAPRRSTISIVASKQGYGTNSTKVHNKFVHSLETAPQAERDILLTIDAPPPPCTEPPQQAGELGIDVKEFDMKNSNLQFYIKYNMINEPDEMIVYCGRKNNLGKVLFTTGGKVSGTGQATINMQDCGNSTWITVKIIADAPGTKWSYWFVCPQLVKK